MEKERTKEMRIVGDNESCCTMEARLAVVL
jgi:hypothetical protein